MGRYPFLNYGNQYLADMKTAWAESTYRTERNRINDLNKELERLKAKGAIKTTNPTKFEEGTITKLLDALRNRGIKPVTLGKYIERIRGFLRWVGNPVMERMANRKKLPSINRSKKEVEMVPIDQAELKRIQDGAEEMHGWRGDIGRFIVAFYPYTGLRVSELRRAHVEDLDTDRWLFFVRHPKGENTYGRNRTVPVPPPAREATFRFLLARQKRLTEHSRESKYLVPTLESKTDRPMSGAAFRAIKKRLQDVSGVEFNLRKFRPTFAQTCVDKGVSIEAVGKVLGHASTVTTERFYARIRDEKAIQEINDVWKSPRLPEPIKRPEKQYPPDDLRGYV